MGKALRPVALGLFLLSDMYQDINHLMVGSIVKLNFLLSAKWIDSVNHIHLQAIYRCQLYTKPMLASIRLVSNISKNSACVITADGE